MEEQPLDGPLQPGRCLHTLFRPSGYGLPEPFSAGTQPVGETPAAPVAASGDWVCIMDADLQDPPELLPQMLAELEATGADCAAARRISREGEPPLRSLCAHMFYRLFRRISSIPLSQGERDFRVMGRPMVDAVLSLDERVRFTKGIFSYVGFSTCWVEYDHTSRISGTSSWSLRGLFGYAMNGIASFSAALAILMVATATSQPLQGISVFCLGSLVFFCLFLTLGTISYYLSRIYLEVKQRPLYFIRERR